ncbi:hypothetical protein [Ferruginibacter sp.]
MKKLSVLIVLTATFATAEAQTGATDSMMTGRVTVNKDPRLELLAKQEADINKATVGLGVKNAKGYRLLVVNSNDRNYAMKVRETLLQRFPEQKVYTTFQAPFIKVKFGDFVEKNDAEKYRKILTNSKIVTTNIYMVPEVVEVKVDKNKEEND